MIQCGSPAFCCHVGCCLLDNMRCTQQGVAHLKTCTCADPGMLPAMQLFLGDTNRTISETPMNQASSRSHCIFTIYVEARKVILQYAHVNPRVPHAPFEYQLGVSCQCT